MTVSEFESKIEGLTYKELQAECKKRNLSSKEPRNFMVPVVAGTSHTFVEMRERSILSNSFADISERMLACASQT